MNEQPTYGKILFSAFAVIATAWGVAHIALCLAKNLITFCAVYVEERPTEPPAFDEIEEQDAEGR